MTEPFLNLLGCVSAGQNLSRAHAADAIGHIVSGQCDAGQIGLFLTALAAKGETAQEVAGAAEALRRHMTPLRHRYPRLLDTCGTGGGGSTLFNVSTTAAVVIAACGVPVAKHGNRSVTSRSGSADVLAELGVNIDAKVLQVERCLDELGIGFCFAPLMHPAMRHVAAVRKQLGIRTIFNILGPLANPAQATNQLLGAGRPELRPLLADALQILGTERALVVSGEDGLGEVTLAGATHVTKVTPSEQHEFDLAPADFGLESTPLDRLSVSNPAESAAIVHSVLAGEPGPARDIVLINAAAGIMAYDGQETPRMAAHRAATAIDEGAARALLEKLIDLSRD